MSGKAAGQGQGTAASEGEAVASVRARWVEALRSGRYAQAVGCLRTGDGHCCLGVLSDLVAPRAWLPAGEVWLHGGNLAMVTKEVREAAAIGADHVDTLIAMNDVRRCTFAEIADYIESLPLPESAS